MMDDPSPHKFRDGFNRWGVAALSALVAGTMMTLIGIKLACEDSCSLSKEVPLPVPESE